MPGSNVAVEPFNSWRELSVARRGNRVFINGSIRATATLSGTPDTAFVGQGCRPQFEVEIPARLSGDTTQRYVTVYPNGAVRWPTTLASGGRLLINGEFDLA